jgi:chaperone required for assembly of F1-ATPase
MMKRFWDVAAPIEAEAGWQVALDARPVRIPGEGSGSPLLLPVRALAEAVAGEWQAAGGGKGGELTYDDLPLTRLAGTAQARIAPDPAAVALELARYAESDLLCYRADFPVQLAGRQHEAWQPWLDWAAERHGAQLRWTTGIIHVAQEPAALAALAAATARLSPHQLAALGVAVPSMSSLVLGLALAEGALDAERAYAIAHLDETTQIELWGHDEEAEARLRQVAADIAVAGRLLTLLRAAA